MSLRAGPAAETFALPDGRSAVVRVGLLDPYIDPAEQTTVALELRADDEVLAAPRSFPPQERVGRKRATGLEPATPALEGQCSTN